MLFKKKLYQITDTETSMSRKVIDFAAVICDRQGKIYHQISVLVSDYYDTETLFYDRTGGYFGRINLAKREQAYKTMLANGTRKMGSVAQINEWLDKARKLGVVSTAYNLEFDKGVCYNSGIDLDFDNEFCLWHEAQEIYGKRKGFINFCIQNGLLTAKFNLKTGAEAISAYVAGKFTKEPHTALEDILHHELPVLVNLLRQKKGFKRKAYNWRNYQLKNLVTAI